MDDVQVIELAPDEVVEGSPRPGRASACLSCHLDRMLEQYGCQEHRFTRRWARSRRRGTAGGLVRWAAAGGGCCCDGEVAMNGLRLPSARRRGGVLCDAAYAARRAPDDDGRPRACSGVDGGGDAPAGPPSSGP